MELIVLEVDQLEALEQHAHDERRLLQRELAPDTGALAIAKRFVDVGWSVVLRLAREAVRVERLGGVAPHRRVPMQHGGQDQDFLTLGELIATTDDGRLERIA